MRRESTLSTLPRSLAVLGVFYAMCALFVVAQSAFLFSVWLLLLPFACSFIVRILGGKR